MWRARLPLERIGEDKLRDWVEDFGGKALKLNLTGERGWPDRLVCLLDVSPFFIEFKREGEDLEPLQLHRHAELRCLGIEVYVAWSFEQALFFVEQELIGAYCP